MRLRSSRARRGGPATRGRHGVRPRTPRGALSNDCAARCRSLGQCCAENCRPLDTDPGILAAEWGDVDEAHCDDPGLSGGSPATDEACSFSPTTNAPWIKCCCGR